MAIRPLLTLEDVDALLQGSAARPVILLKHSTACPVSARARAEFAALESRWAAAAGGPDFALVRVIEERPVSRALAARLGVPHQSPQAILVHRGRAAWHASHGEVTAAAMEAAWRRLTAAGG